MNFQYCFDKTEIKQYSFLDIYIREQLSDYGECLAFWYYDDSNPVSVAIYGMADAGEVHLLYMATIPGYQMMGCQTKLQSLSEDKLKSIGIGRIVSYVNTDEGAISNAFDYEDQEELLKYFGYYKQPGIHRYICIYKNSKGRILHGTSPRDFLENVNKTNEILKETDISGLDRYKIQLYRSGTFLADNEHGLFAVKDGIIKDAIIWKDSKQYDFYIKKMVKFTEGASFIGSLLTTYIITHSAINEREFVISAPASLDMAIMNNILGEPIGREEIYSYTKIIG